jgi:hypothetical protein
VLGGATIAGVAYVADYHLVPKRFTPGWEKRLDKASLALVYAMFGLALPLRNLLAKRRFVSGGPKLTAPAPVRRAARANA